MANTTNLRIRRAMVDAGLSQSGLAKLLDIPQPEVSIMLKYELATEFQKEIIAKIKEAKNEPA